VAIILLNKPYGVVCQFSPHATRPTLKDFVAAPDVYPAGRLDWDSEGLVVLTNDGRLQHRIANPARKLAKVYWVQVEGLITDVSIERLAVGIDLGDFVSRPAHAARMDEPLGLWPRDPPIRTRKAIPTSWLEIILTEGKHRQIRRMTAATGFPALRLIRWRIGPWSVSGLQPGEHKPAPEPFR
jgi:23S rRNA pseudouridine2457 synthase